MQICSTHPTAGVHKAWLQLLFGCGICLVVISQTQADETVRFNRDIRPILSDKCYYCHGPDEETREADLRLDSFAAATHDLGGYAAITAGDPDESHLMDRITDADDPMPPVDSKKSLTADEIELIRRWITEGAEYEQHWSFRPIEKPSPPVVEGSDWIKNEIDHFVLQRLQREDIKPSPEADRATLIRRLSIDLLGLLPEPAQVEAFVNDKRPNAYGILVDKLLANRHYGERWGRHWLDQARYADSHGYSIDSPRQMWPYRDWVVKAFNKDMPFNKFTIEQVAGDLLPDATKSQLIATAFHRNTLINQEGGSHPEQFRVEAAMDRVNTTGAVWLGLTIGCAQCHTHKFDPIQHREYYEMFAFFNSGSDRNSVGKTLRVAEGEVFGADIESKAYKPMVDTPKEARAKAAESTAEKVEASESKSSKKDDAKKNAKPKDPRANLMVMEDLPKPRQTYLLTRGDFTRPDKELGQLYPGGLSCIEPPLPAKSGRTRLDLARWLVDDRNPLTPRVTMNRIWMRYFDIGLVETEEDFGLQGSLPSHPELLDWLAAEFVERGWSMKEMHRLIVSSGTYRQQSNTRPELNEIDARNTLLARQNRIRFDAEVVRDAALQVSGLLSKKIGGPSVFPPQPGGVYSFTQHGKSWETDQGTDRYRRAMYTMFFRSAPYPLFTTFDAPDFSQVCTRRAKSNTPLQALNVANDPVFLEFARGLAKRLSAGNSNDPEHSTKTTQWINQAFELCLSRQPSHDEMRILTQYVETQIQYYNEHPKAAEQIASPELIASTSDAGTAAALVSLARVMFNTDNFITRE